MEKPTPAAGEDAIIKAYYAMRDKLLTYMRDVRFNSEQRIRHAEPFKKISEIPEDKLPLYINTHEEDSPEHFFIQCRLSGDDPFEKDLGKCLELLYNEEFNMETYKNIGYNDGVASITASLLEAANMPEQSTAASEAIYTFD